MPMINDNDHQSEKVDTEEKHISIHKIHREMLNDKTTLQEKI